MSMCRNASTPHSPNLSKTWLGDFSRLPASFAEVLSIVYDLIKPAKTFTDYKVAFKLGMLARLELLLCRTPRRGTLALSQKVRMCDFLMTKVLGVRDAIYAAHVSWQASPVAFRKHDVCRQAATSNAHIRDLVVCGC